MLFITKKGNCSVNSAGVRFVLRADVTIIISVHTKGEKQSSDCVHFDCIEFGSITVPVCSDFNVKFST